MPSLVWYISQHVVQYILPRMVKEAFTLKASGSHYKMKHSTKLKCNSEAKLYTPPRRVDPPRFPHQEEYTTTIHKVVFVCPKPPPPPFSHLYQLLSTSPPPSVARNQVAGHQERLLVAKVGDVAKHARGLGAPERLAGALLVLPGQERGDGVRGLGLLARPGAEVVVLDHLPLLEAVGLPRPLHQGHVRLDVVVHVKGRVRLVGVENLSLESHGCGVGGVYVCVVCLCTCYLVRIYVVTCNTLCDMV